MNYKEFEALIEQLKEQGLDDDKIMHVLVTTFEQGKCSIEDLELMVDWLGFELTDEFYTDHGIRKK